MASYPRDFFADRKDQRDPGLCFVLMPFNDQFSKVWDVIKKTTEGERFNLQCLRADAIARPGYIMEDVLEYIARAGTILAELSGRNPNVFYELGIAHATAPPASVYLLSQTLDDVPFDLRDLRCLIYDGDLAKLETQLTESLAQGNVGQFKLDVREGGVSKVPARLSGTDRCLYDLEIEGAYLGADSVKFLLRVTRLVVGQQPEVITQEGQYLSKQSPTIRLPWGKWNLRFRDRENDAATILVQRRDE